MEDPPVAPAMESDTAVAAAAAPSDDPVAEKGKGVRKQQQSPVPPTTTSVTDAVTLASLTQASQLCTQYNLPGLAHLLSQKQGRTREGSTVVLLDSAHESSTEALIPGASAVEAAARRALGSFGMAENVVHEDSKDLSTPFLVHWSKNDLATGTIRIAPEDIDKKTLTTSALRGYRLARANVGYNGVLPTAEDPASVLIYYEVLLHEGPTAHEILQQLPPHCRLGLGLQRKLNHAFQQEELHQQSQAPLEKKARIGNEDSDTEDSAQRPVPSVGGHVRVGWAMRTADVHAPVGYDRWSFGIRSLSGSIIHQSLRQDDWMDVELTTAKPGEADPVGRSDAPDKTKDNPEDDEDSAPFAGPGDILGCGIQLNPPGTASGGPALTGSSSGPQLQAQPPLPSVPNASAPSGSTIADDPQNPNHIRFFLNGTGLGQFVMSKGKREGGEAFSSIPHGTYYPAVSIYLGGKVTANFGPYWIHQPKKLPTKLARKASVQPISSLVSPPMSPEQTVEALQSNPVSKHLFKGMNLGGNGSGGASGGLNSISAADWQKSFLRAAECEARIRCQAYEESLQRHIAWVRKERLARGLSINDLPPPSSSATDKVKKDANAGAP
jgi:hypothetical protein